MREIKFRAWDKSDSLMYYDVQKGIRFDDGSEYAFSRFLEAQENGDYHKWELMQFTGLKDKNGKEIYEGDVVKQTWKRETEFGEVSISPSQGVLVGNHVFWQFNSEVIGNIYENPELLT